MRPIISIQHLIRSNGKRCFICGSTKTMEGRWVSQRLCSELGPTTSRFCKFGDSLLLTRTPIEHLLCLMAGRVQSTRFRLIHYSRILPEIFTTFDMDRR
ncbi:hypothetical protein Hanom_Chr05g00394371 [Helianthus anomalus]